MSSYWVSLWKERAEFIKNMMLTEDSSAQKEKTAIMKEIAETSTKTLEPPLGETELIQKLVSYVLTSRFVASLVGLTLLGTGSSIPSARRLR